MAETIEHEICINCKKEIPHHNYVMHTMHCARNISLCPVCKEPIQKNRFEEHKQQHSLNINKARDCSIRKEQCNKESQERSQKLSQNHNKQEIITSKQNIYKNTNDVKSTKESNEYMPTSDYGKPSKDSLLPCKYCDLELPKLDLEDHENYCGARTDKCIECGELVMFKYKKIHEDSNHGFIKLSDEPGPRPSWDSSTQRSTATSSNSVSDSGYSRRSRLPPLRPFDMTTLYDMTDYIPPTTSGRYGGSDTSKSEKHESYKDMSRRLDCKTEYIRNLLHDSASITVPLRSGGTVPRNHFNHSKGPAPQPPRRRNPPTVLTIPCEFCDTPIPHEELIQHESGCRPDLARFNPRRRSPELDEYFVAPQAQPSSPEVDLPCEFCCDMIPASQLLRHQATCN